MKHWHIQIVRFFAVSYVSLIFFSNFKWGLIVFLYHFPQPMFHISIIHVNSKHLWDSAQFMLKNFLIRFYDLMQNISQRVYFLAYEYPVVRDLSCH